MLGAKIEKRYGIHGDLREGVRSVRGAAPAAILSPRGATISRSAQEGSLPRVAALIQFYLFAVLGVFLVAVPWTELWNQAVAALGQTSIADGLGEGWVRGLVSGVGVLDLILAARDGRALLASPR